MNLIFTFKTKQDAQENHQRIGRLNRYGQKKQVEVVVLRNPETVEGRIWEILQERIDQIMNRKRTTRMLIATATADRSLGSA